MEQNTSTELLGYSEFEIYNKNGLPDLPRPQIRVFFPYPLSSPCWNPYKEPYGFFPVVVVLVGAAIASGTPYRLIQADLEPLWFQKSSKPLYSKPRKSSQHFYHVLVILYENGNSIILLHGATVKSNVEELKSWRPRWSRFSEFRNP